MHMHAVESSGASTSAGAIAQHEDQLIDKALKSTTISDIGQSAAVSQGDDTTSVYMYGTAM